MTGIGGSVVEFEITERESMYMLFSSAEYSLAYDYVLIPHNIMFCDLSCSGLLCPLSILRPSNGDRDSCDAYSRTRFFLR